MGDPTFRDVLVSAIYRLHNEDDSDLGPMPHNEVDAVLASDEMQAIRRALHRMADSLRSTVHLDEIPWLLGDVYKLPPHVIAWVLGGDQ